MKSTLPKLLLIVPACLSLCASSVLAQDESASLAKRAEAYGSFANLPASTEAAISIMDLNGMFNEIVTSNVFQKVLELSGQSGDDADQAINQAREALDAYGGKEVTLAYAKGTAAEMKRLMTLYESYVRVNYGGIGRSLSGGDFDGDIDPEMLMAEVKKKLADANSPMSKAIDQFQMPPIILGSKMGGAAAGVIAQINELEAQLPPFVTVSKFEAAGVEFKSMAVNLKDVFDENAQAQMEEFLGDKATSDRLAKVIRGKRVEVSYGSVGDYFVVGLGSDHSHLEFVEDPSKSLLSLPAFKKLDPYLGKPIHGLAYATKEYLESGDTNQFMGAMVDSFVEGVTSGGSDVMTKLGGKVKKMGEILERANTRSASEYIGVMIGGHGLTGHGFGGWMMDSIDGKKPLAFASADIDSAFMVFDTVSKEKYNDVGVEMMETMMSALPLGAKAYGQMSGDESGMNEFNKMSKIFTPKVEKIWNIMKTKVYPALGQNSAMIVDLNGSLPKIPGVPRVLVNKGKAPRIAMANTVKDRKKLTEAWGEIVPAVNDLLAAIPDQEAGAEVQMPDALSSEKDGLTTHYFGMPFLSNDFMPSLSLSDKLFFLSSSKKFSESLSSTVGKGKQNMRGIYVGMDFNQLNSFATSWLKLVRENKDVVFEGNEFAAEDFEENADMILQVLKLSNALESFDYNKYTSDSDETRSTWHLKLKDVK